MEKQKRRQYDEDFKRNSLALNSEQELTVTEVAANLGIEVNLLCRMNYDPFGSWGTISE